MKLKTIITGIIVLISWVFVYSYLQFFASWLAFDVLSLHKGAHLSAAIEFFLYETPKVLMLLIPIVFVVGIIRSYFTPERTKKILSGKREATGNVLAAVLGIVTPFCSCSAIPLFIGFVTTGIPLGVTFSFLISAPMVNEVALVLLLGLFGWKIALIYLVTGLTIAIVSGWIIGKLKLEKYVEDWVYRTKQSGSSDFSGYLTFESRIGFGVDAVKDILGRVWLYIVIGIGVGAGIHGYAPENLMASFMGKGTWWSVPVAVLIGVPMYSNAAGIIPVVQALLEKGAALGTVLAFMMAVIGLSLPETIILRKVLKPKLIAVFLSIVAFGIMIVGYLFNFIF